MTIIKAFGFCSLLEERSDPAFLNIDCFRISHLHRADCTADFICLKIRIALYIDHKMKMVGYQAIGKYIKMTCQVMLDFVQKIVIILFPREDHSAIVSTIVDVVKLIWGKMHN